MPVSKWGSRSSKRNRRIGHRVGVVVVTLLVVMGGTAALAAPASAASDRSIAPGPTQVVPPSSLPSGEYLVTVDFAEPLGEVVVPVTFSDGDVSVGGTVDRFVLLGLLFASGGDVDGIEVATLSGMEPPVSSSRVLSEGLYVVDIVIDDEAYQLRADVDDGNVDLLTPAALFDALRELSSGGELRRFSVFFAGA